MKDSITEKLNQWGERFESFSLRERGLIFGAIVVVLFMTMDAMMLSPQEVKQKQIINNMVEQNKKLEGISVKVTAMTDKLRGGEVQYVKTRISELQELLASLVRKQKDLTVEFIRPEQMAVVLRDMLDDESALKLIKLESLGVKPLFPPPVLSPVEMTELEKNKNIGKKEKKNEEIEGPNIYKHGMRVEFEGDYSSTVNYLQALESMQWRFYWDNVEYQVLEYPVARVVITVHTLSLNEGWIGV